MQPREHTCCFTGHRPEKLPWGSNEFDPRCVALKELIYDAVSALYHSGITHFICGMALGCDTYFCEAVVALRGERPEITLEAAIPCETQSARWSEADKKRYNALVTDCDFQTLVTRDYASGCMEKRNRYMVDRSSKLLAVCSDSPGGSMNTMLYAAEQDVDIVRIFIP